MPQAKVNKLQIEYEVLGSNDAPPVLLIMGLGAQLVFWPESFCQGLVRGGYRVIRFDHRDCGLSTKLPQLGTPNRMAMALRVLLGLKVRAEYGLEDMASDALGVLDAIGIQKAHVVGVSMGGMIGQIVAARAPDRVLSFTSVMSASGNRKLMKPRPALIRLMSRRPPRKDELEKAIEYFITRFTAMDGPAFPSDPEELRGNVSRSLHRSYEPDGGARHAAAVLSAPDRRDLLQTIRVPTLVIHGSADPVLPLAAGHETARLIPGAKLKVIEGMGHGMPPGTVPILLDALLEHFRTNLGTESN